MVCEKTSQEVQKLYSMTDSLWVILKDCLYINAETHPIKPVSRPQAVILDINAADSVALQAIYGIGPVLSARIVKYRNLLGGFYSMDQLTEVYGLDSMVIARIGQRFTIKKSAIYHKLHINSLDYGGLVRHPYLNSMQVKAILAYREQHGSFFSTEQLKEIHLIDDSTYIKLYPYLDF